MADTSRHSLRKIAETTYGVTPATPVFRTLRQTSTSLSLSKNTSKSEEKRADRQIVDYTHGAYQIGGEFGFELSCTSFDDELQAVLCGTWTANVLKAGTVRRSFTLERYFADLGSSNNPYHRFPGCEYNTLSLSVKPDARVTGSFGIIGKSMSTNAAIVTGATYPAASTTPVVSSFTGTIREGGSLIAVITELSLNLNNGMAAKFVVGSNETIRPSIGESNVSGSITAYFENSTLLNKFINETTSSIEFSLPDGTGKSLTFLMPRVKYNGGQPDVSGDGAIQLTMPFQALYDSVEETNLKITRV